MNIISARVNVEFWLDKMQHNISDSKHGFNRSGIIITVGEIPVDANVKI